MSDHALHQAGKEMMNHLGHGAVTGHGTSLAHHTGSGMGLGSGIAKGAAMAGATSLFRNPLVMFALGAAAGILAYKYRKEIVAYAARAGDVGRDFVLQQKESLNDLLEEAREEEAAETPEGAPAPGS